MSHITSARLFVAATLAVTLAACSTPLPVTPDGFAAAGGGRDDQAPPGSSGVPGVYALSFFAQIGGTYQYLTTMPVRTAELWLKARVTDTLGNPATLGTVTFEYCSYGKGPAGDINRPDEAPKEACEQGEARWVRLDSIYASSSCSVFGGGTSCLGFGTVRIPRTVGFRFKYAQRKGTIASGISEARNFVWTE